jgi:hypothetical protein
VHIVEIVGLVGKKPLDGHAAQRSGRGERRVGRVEGEHERGGELLGRLDRAEDFEEQGLGRRRRGRG